MPGDGEFCTTALTVAVWPTLRLVGRILPAFPSRISKDKLLPLWQAQVLVDIADEGWAVIIAAIPSRANTTRFTFLLINTSLYSSIFATSVIFTPMHIKISYGIIIEL